MISEKIMNEIRELYYAFYRTDDYYEKSYIWYVIYDLKEIFPNNYEIRKMYYDLMQRSDELFQSVKIEENEVNAYIQEKKDFITQNIILPKNIIPWTNKPLDKINMEKLFGLFNAFLKSVDYDLYAFYRMMIEEERIFIANSNHTVSSSLNTAKTLIFIKQFDSLYDLLVLSHELGHAYYIYITNQKISERRFMNNRLKEEIPAFILEKLLIDFLNDKQIVDGEKVLQNQFDLLMLICDQKKDNFELLKSLIGSYVARNIDDNISINECFRYIYHTDLEKILSDVNRKKVLRKLD